MGGVVDRKLLKVSVSLHSEEVPQLNPERAASVVPQIDMRLG